ncbi:hypothetical protein AAW12_23625 [Sphingobacterium sp. Ag1]|uniref:hypothetical protein n=1 Tax=Sphingobacterium sp. Ag1 TaxID=1643451 RepID=UPI000627C805|nr:hypothetical protein [Sphingobacterium sp. Ag1]KKO89128.1 hypothetical protein AAW12_23625 [Sphingobacterium sp. Ag1]
MELAFGGRSSLGKVFGNVIRRAFKVFYNGKSVPVYRGGNSFKLRPNDVKINIATGNVKTTHRLSLDVNPNNISKFGGAYQIDASFTVSKLVKSN